MGQLAAFLVTFFKGTQALRDLFRMTVTLYYAQEEAADTRQMNEVEKERSAIVAALKQPGLTDDQVRAFHKRLIALTEL